MSGRQPTNNMPVIITACVSKKVGQANYGSAGYSLTVQSEVSNLDQVREESRRLYNLLNESVNSELSGENNHEKRAEWPTIVRNNAPQEQQWKASEKQRDLILKVIEDNNLDRSDIEDLAGEMFGTNSLPELNRLQASGLMDEMLTRWGKKKPTGRFNGRASR